MELTFSPLPLAVGGRGDSFTFMVEDFDLDGGAAHHHHSSSVASPTRDTTVPSSPAGNQISSSSVNYNSAGSLKMPVSIGRRNSFDWAANGSGRHRSLSFEFFNMDASSSSSSSSGPMMSSHHHMSGGFASMMSPEDALLMQAATPKGMSSLKRKHLPFSSHFIGGSTNSNVHMSGSSSNGYGHGGYGYGAMHPMSVGASMQGPRSKKYKKERKARQPKLNPDGTKMEKKKKPKKVRGPRKTRAKKNEEPVEVFDPSIPRIGIYTLPQRAEKIKKWMEKARRRVWDKKIKYGCRKRLADARPRYKGRFVKSLPEEKLSIKKLDDDAAGKPIDPELLAAQEATRMWKVRQAAAAAKATIDAKAGIVSPAAVPTGNIVPVNMTPPMQPSTSVLLSAVPDATEIIVAASSSSDGDSTPRSPVTVTVTKQIPSSNNVTSEKLDFAEPRAIEKQIASISNIVSISHNSLI